MVAHVALFLFALFATVLSAPAALDQNTLLKNAQTAQVLNTRFQSMSRTDKCNGESCEVFRPFQGLTIGCLLDEESACIDGQHAACNDSAWKLTRCPGSRKCFALPSIRRPGTVSSGRPYCGTNTDHLFSSSDVPPNLTLSRLSREQVERAG